MKLCSCSSAGVCVILKTFVKCLMKSSPQRKEDIHDCTAMVLGKRDLGGLRFLQFKENKRQFLPFRGPFYKPSLCSSCLDGILLA